jgi:hypothetical protein
MKKNVGMTDKIIRGTVAAIIALLVFSQYNYWYTTALVLGSIALILFITSVISFVQCMHYLAIVAVRQKK